MSDPAEAGTGAQDIICFLGCAFTNVPSPELVAIGLVTLHGQEQHYVELDITTPTARQLIDRASQFERDHLIAQCGLPEFKRCCGDLGLLTRDWLIALAPENSRLLVAFDHPTRYRLFEEAISHTGVDRRAVSVVPLNMRTIALSRGGEEAAGRCYRTLVARGIRRHHAMADALALRAAYVNVVETSVRLTGVLHSPEFRRLVTLLETMIDTEPNYDLEGWARLWLTEELYSLGGERPLDLIDAPGGLERLERALQMMSSGAYA